MAIITNNPDIPQKLKGFLGLSHHCWAKPISRPDDFLDDEIDKKEDGLVEHQTTNSSVVNKSKHSIENVLEMLTKEQEKKNS